MAAGAHLHLGPLLLVAAPLLAAVLLAALPRPGRRLLDAVAIGTTTGAFAGSLVLAALVLEHGRVTTALPAALGPLSFTLDGFGAAFALVATFLWACATVYAGAYLERDGRERRYHLTSLVALSAMLGVVAAGDLMTLYVFFEWLGLSAYLFVVHVGGPAARRAGTKYLVMTLLGGLAVLTGVLLVHALGGGDLATAVPWVPGSEALRAAAAVLLVGGFGVKAGALGLHVWLPDAHTVAPAPASALLSGVMIKAGAYGILRTAGALFGPEAEGPLAALHQGEALGWALLLWGGATMLAGVVMALWQTEAKRLLAYSSVSQMGFVLVGIGAARVLGEEGGIGYAGAALHVVHHALFKGLLFLGSGAVIHATGVGDLRRLGGLARRMPWTFALVVVAAAGIAGVPALAGFVSKSVLHHALGYAEGAGPLGVVVWVERAFTVTTFGTAAALIKLVALTFLGAPRSDAAAGAVEAPWRMRAPMAALALAVVVLGLRPTTLAPLVAQGLAAWRLPTEDVARWFGSPIVHAGDLRAALVALAVGAGVAWTVARFGLDRHPPPAWASWDRILLGLVVSVALGLRRLGATWTLLGERARALALHESEVVAAAIERPPLILRRTWPRFWRAVVVFAHRWALVGRIAGGALEALAQRLDGSERLAEPGQEDGDGWVLAARQRIQRDSRDLGRAIGAVFVGWLVVLGTLLGGPSR